MESEKGITPVVEPPEPLEEGEITDEEECNTIIVPPSATPSPSVESINAEPSDGDGVSSSITSLAYLAPAIRTSPTITAQSTESSKYNW